MKIKNFGLLSLLFFIIIGTFNDIWSINFGKPTLLHITYFLLLISVNIFKTKNKKINFIRNLLIFYLLVITTLSFITSSKYSSGISSISIFLNTLIIILLIPYFSKIDEKDFKLFFSYLFLSLIITVLIPGSYELITGNNISSADGLSENLFNIRGLSIDKIDFAYGCIILIATSFFLIRTKIFNILFLLLIIFLSLILFAIFSV